MKRALLALGALVLVIVLALVVSWFAVYSGGEEEGGGDVVATRPERKNAPRGEPQILFGDLHVHTTFSTDAFVMSLPLLGGEGAHPAADACDFARFCSAIDFFALTDHAEALSPNQWSEVKRSIRQCNAVAGDPTDPDIVAYIGWEWSQVGRVPEEHFGHKNVIFRGLSDTELPARPIAAPGLAGNAMVGSGIDLVELAQVPWRDYDQRQRYLNLVASQRALTGAPLCAEGVDSRELPPDCREFARDPAQLFEKLDQWGIEALVIPHGTTWGFYTPPGYTWDKQLAPSQDDPDRQRLIEVYSGHGNSEEARPWRAVDLAPDGSGTCPAPREGYEPCCWRAGEIIRSRCEAPGEACEAAVLKARADYLLAGVGGHIAVPGATVEDWKGCGQCLDCETPSFSYRPGGAAQYILARGHFEPGAAPRHTTLGFIASSDNHKARPGTGYKEYARRKLTEATGAVSPVWDKLVLGPPQAPTPASRTWTQEELTSMAPWLVVYAERQASFFLTGGLVAVHAMGRDRDAIYDALKARHVYGTSGPRIMLWFDAVDAQDRRLPMGSSLDAARSPRFEVRALGELVQKPGCPQSVEDAIGADEVARLCAGECYNPGEERRRISRIEVVRIWRQREAGEAVQPLIEDAFLRFDCPDDPSGCRFSFEDPEFADRARDVVYYVRAVQEPTPAVNGGQLRCKDAACTEVDPCYGDHRTPFTDDCLAPIEERAWSSPIYLHHVADAAPPSEVEGAP